MPQGVMPSGHEATGKNRCTRSSTQTRGRTPLLRLEQIVQRGCGVSVRGDPQEPSGCQPLPCALGRPCLHQTAPCAPSLPVAGRCHRRWRARRASGTRPVPTRSVWVSPRAPSPCRGPAPPARGLSAASRDPPAPRPHARVTCSARTRAASRSAPPAAPTAPRSPRPPRPRPRPGPGPPRRCRRCRRRCRRSPPCRGATPPDRRTPGGAVGRESPPLVLT